MSLLDDVSIVVTPNGYKAGELYAVIPVPTEGAELVTNGDFATDSDWDKSPSGVTISGGFANFTSGQDTYVFQDIMVIGKRYIMSLDYNITSITGSAYFGSNGGSGNAILSMTGLTGAGTLSGEITASATKLIVRSSTFSGTVTNVSVKEYTSADMDVTRATAATRVDENGLVNYAEVIGGEEVTNGDFATDGTPATNTWTLGWYSNTANVSISGGKITLTNSASEADSRAYATNGVSSNNVLTTNQLYKLQYQVVANNGVTSFKYYSSSGVFIDAPIDLGVTHTIYIKNTSNQLFLFQNATTNSNISLDNVSVKEVTRDNVPRIDYTGGGCPHILAEPMRTNFIPYSEDFSQWTAVGSPTLTPDYGLSPDGTENSTRIEFSTNERIYTSLSASGYIAFSVYLKGSGVITLRDNTNAYRQDVTLTSEWARYDLYFNATITNVQIQNQTASAVDCELWGAQLEVGSYATSYIPNFGTALGVTRNQDIFTRDGIGSLINSTEGVLFIEFKTLSETGTFRQFNLSKDSGNRIYITKRGDSGNLEFRMENPSGNLNFTFAENTTNDFVKVAFRYGLNNFAVFIDGVNKNVTSTGNVFASGTLNTLEFDSPLSQPFYGNVRQLQVYDTALDDTQLAALTS